jgi:hypothetical protein
MPNGGSDCCGTCWFNARNAGQSGDVPAGESIAPFCTIRHLPIDDAYWTYCSNHPHHNPRRLAIPVGPVYVADRLGFGRVVWQPSPDTEEVRTELLRILSEATGEATMEYPAGLTLAEAAAHQLGEFREVRALRSLERARSFDRTNPEDPDLRGAEFLSRLAEEALGKVLPRGSLSAFLTADVTALARSAAGGKADHLPVLADALEDAGCSDAALLTHLRDPGDHPGPCWVALALIPPPAGDAPPQ